MWENGAIDEAPGAHDRTDCATETLIEPGPDSLVKYWREVRQYSGLIYLLLWRNIKLRYRQTIIGAAWALLQPLLAMVIFTILFARLITIPTGGAPYPLFALSALVPWTYFVHALTLASKCLIDHHDLVTKTYFPRLILPLVAVLEAAVDFLIAFAFLCGIVVVYGFTPRWSTLLLAPLFLLLMTTALGAGLWLSALNLKFRDISNALPFMTQLLLFITPVAYSSSLVPAGWRGAYALNPLAGVIEGFRWALLSSATIAPASLFVSIVAGVALLASGLWFFRSREDCFYEDA